MPGQRRREARTSTCELARSDKPERLRVRGEILPKDRVAIGIGRSAREPDARSRCQLDARLGGPVRHRPLFDDLSIDCEDVGGAENLVVLLLVDDIVSARSVDQVDEPTSVCPADLGIVETELMRQLIEH